MDDLQVNRQPDGRLHLHHGPIDLLIGIDAESAAESAAAESQAIACFRDVLPGLVAELALLRTPLSGPAPPHPRGAVARRMVRACWPHRTVFVTPMAAVAGSVADEVIDALARGRRLRSAHVNNGGDIALRLALDGQFRIGMAEVEDGRLRGTLTLAGTSPWRGVATSGWRGRSLSLGIADAVTVVARQAADADVAATLVANAVDIEHAAVERRPARSVRDDSDLGTLPVTVAVGPLPPDAIDIALARGADAADAMLRHGLIGAACLRLQGRAVVRGNAFTLTRDRLPP